MKPHVLAVGLTWVAVAGTRAELSPKPGDVVYECRFDSADEQKSWPVADFASWSAGRNGTRGLQVTANADGLAGRMLRIPLDLEKYRGCQLMFECMARAENVSKPDKPWLGVKFMLHYATPREGPVWRNENDVFGDFDWRKLSFTTRIAPDATRGELSLGLQGSTGTVWFDDLRITVFKGPPPKRPSPPANPPPAFKGHELPRLRGVMSPNEFREEDLRTLGTEWNANLIRWQITRNWGKAGTDRDLADYDRWFDAKLDDLDKALDSCKRHGVMVVIDMHTPPGGRYENRDLAIFHEPVYQDHWIALWEKVAKRFMGHPAVWGYDLVNEPVQNSPSPPGVADYLGAQVRCARAIRIIDARTPIFIEAAEWDSAEGFKDLEPVDVPRVIYQVHMYVPGTFTHQGVHGEKRTVAYPGVIDGRKWDKEALRAVLEPVREFQLAYNVHIYAGEFGAARWAPGARDYLSDCIGIFEEYGWDWSYHAYREWDGWSVEHGPDPENHEKTREPTDRKQLLLEWFAKNQKPRR
jgi:hypothetical protein